MPRSHSAAADCAYGVLGNIVIRMYSCTTMSTQPPNDKTSVNDILPKNGLLKVTNILSADRKQYCLSFDTPQPFSCGRLCIWLSWNIDIRMYSCTTMSTQPPNYTTSVKDILPKNGLLKVTNILSADRKQYCLSFDTPQPFSRGRLCIWRSWNIDIRMYSCTTMSTQPPNYTTSVKDILPKNGSLKVTNISSADRQQYCLSFDTPQPFSRGRLCIWRSWKHRYQDVFLHDHVNTASKWQDFS